MTLRVHHTIGDLERDLRIGPQARRDMRDTVREGITVGADVAGTLARRRYHRYGFYYARSITAEMHGISSDIASQGTVYSGEWGPDPARKQGNMAFEHPSRNQRAPHPDIANSGDVVGDAFVGEVRRLPAKWFR